MPESGRFQKAACARAGRPVRRSGGRGRCLAPDISLVDIHARSAWPDARPAAHRFSVPWRPTAQPFWRKHSMATKEKEEVETEREGTTDGPLLDLSDDAVKKMIKAAKKRGYVTMDELNSVLPSEEVTSEQIEDTMSMLSDMGINVVEDDETGEEQEGPEAADAEEEATELAEQTGTAVAATPAKKEPTDRTDDP